MNGYPVIHSCLIGYSRIHDSSPAHYKDKHHKRVAARRPEVPAAQLAARSVSQAAKWVLTELSAARAAVWAVVLVARAVIPPAQAQPTVRNQDYPVSTVRRYSLAGSHRSWGH